ncbi:hypothetical protein F5883DRAFT_134011 [Diaporthe sp. PMI_573]|nr:hypothetical protein F5883DRAFT_134011 [Diaporthaceae sp. PMI_573]
MRRLDRSILPCLACVPGTALLVLPIDHSEIGRRKLAISLPHNGNLMHAADIYLTKTIQSDDHDLFARFNG